MALPILSANIGLRQIGIGVYDLQWAPILKMFLRSRNNAWTGDLKWCNYIVCPAESVY